MTWKPSLFTTPLFELELLCITGPPPLGSLEVPIRSGLNALYGRNGAGKTRLLKAMREILLGERSGGQVVVRPRDESQLAEQMLGSLEEWLGDQRERASGHLGEMPWHAPDRSILDRVLGDVLRTKWAEMEAWDGWTWDGDGRPKGRDVVDEVLRNKILALNMHTDGSWDLTVSVRFSEDTPLLAQLRQRVADAWEATSLEMPDLAERPNEDGEYEESWHEQLAEALESFGHRLSRRDFFTVMGPLPDPSAVDEFSFGVERLFAPGALVYIDTVCRGLATGALCEVRTDETLITFDELSASTFRAVDAWGRLAHATEMGLKGPGYLYSLEEVSRERLPLIEPDRTEPRVAVWVAQAIEDLERTANTVLAAMLPEPPILKCIAHKPEEWANGEAFNWRATDPTGSTVSPDQLSGAQTRLVRLALTLAFDAAGHPPWMPRTTMCMPAVMLLDEPEAGLHRLAEDKLTQALHDHGRRNDTAVVAATHSSSFLRNPDVALVEVFRRAHGRSSVRPVEFPDQAGPEALGISRAELLQLYQLILLVEGHHEQLVFSEILGQELGRRRARPVPLRGSFNLNAIVDLEILAHTLEQPVLAVLDNANAEAIERLWAALKTLPEGSGIQDGRPVFEECLGPAKERTDEEKQIASLAENLLKSNQLDRFEVYGLSRGDIIEYLPVERLVPGATSWNELREAHGRAREQAPGRTAKDFKKWLVETHHADFGDDAILLAAAVGAESPPEEFLILLSRIDSIVDGWTR